MLDVALKCGFCNLKTFYAENAGFLELEGVLADLREVSENDEFCIKPEKFCIKNEELCI